jgi:hypothetical protein
MTLARAVALGVALALAAVVGSIAAGSPGAMDFVAQYAAARLVLAGNGAALLDPAAILDAERAAAPARDSLLPFVQPPAVALLLAPLAALPFEAAFLLAAIIDVVLIGLALAMLTSGRSERLAPALMLVAAPAALAIAHAQTTPLVLVLVALADRAGPRSGGLALGLTLVRPQTAPLLILAALADPARRLPAIVGSAIVVAVSAVVVGPAGLARYAEILVGAAGWSISGELGLRSSIGWSGLAIALGVGPLGLMAAFASLVAGAVIVIRAAPDDRVRIAAAWSLLASPHALMHDAVLTYPALFALLRTGVAVDAIAVLMWVGHLAVAPFGVLWSLVVAVAASRVRRVGPAGAPR